LGKGTGKGGRRDGAKWFVRVSDRRALKRAESDANDPYCYCYIVNRTTHLNTETIPPQIELYKK